MVRTGRCYRNLMVGFNARACEKLHTRAVRMVQHVSKCDVSEAERCVLEAGRPNGR
jgi:N-acetylmuramic acid 6-phosphate (MurNAc-6-P) etherase